MSKQREGFEKWLKESNKHVYDVYIDEYSSSDNTENMCAEWAWQAWQQAQKVAVPDGWVVVPREPTKEMYLAGTHELTQIDFRDIYDTDSIQVYKAMIEAGEKK